MTRALLTLSTLAAILAVFAVACGSGSGSDGGSNADLLPKITASDRIFTEEDFLSVGLKKSKTYDVTGLTGAT
ncbi:MAG: hypothetical protein J4N96_08735, partial [Chloroflexi bacterium]|nr:hypothetical protein [Chloroflexota bacterium]